MIQLKFRLRTICVLAFIGFALLSCNQVDKGKTAVLEETTAGLKWYSLENAIEVNKKVQKKVIVDMYTHWCGWCKVMDRQTFADPEVVQYLNENFIMVKFNAETMEPINFKGETFEFKARGRRGANGFAVKMLDGRLAYPSLVYLDADFNKIKVSPGFKKPDQLLSELRAL